MTCRVCTVGRRVAPRPSLPVPSFQCRVNVQQIQPSRITVVAQGKIGYGKDWEHHELNKNGKPVRKKLHVKTGDTVVVIAGDDRGKVGKITEVNRKTGHVFMEGVNMKWRHLQPEREGEKGQRIQRESPIHVSNVMHWSEKEEVRSRLGKKVVDGEKRRYLVKTGELLPN